MHSAYEDELLKATEAMRAALDEILRLVPMAKPLARNGMRPPTAMTRLFATGVP
jgi:hypothetical protein